MTEHVGNKWRRRQRHEGWMDLEGVDSVGEIVPGGNHGQDCAFQVMKQARCEGKCLKQKFRCINKFCSDDVILERVDSHDVVLQQAFDHVDKICVSRFEHDGTYQHVVSSFLGNVASGSINQIHTERSTQPPFCKVATGPSAKVVLRLSTSRPKRCKTPSCIDPTL